METIVLERVVPSVFAADPKAVEGSEIWLREVTFRRGVRYLVEAASGAGKSSLCCFLYGIRDDYEGTIRFDATDSRSLSVGEWCDLRRRSLGLLFQELRLFEELTVWENIALKNDLTRFHTAERIERMLDAARIADKRDVAAGRLSVGQQQRVAFIRALCQPLDFVLLDEPVSHLDETNNRIVADIITEEAARTGAAVIATSVGNNLDIAVEEALKL